MANDNLYSSEGPTPYSIDDRDFGHFSDHITVWIDKHIGVNNTYDEFKAKFNNNVQVLQSNNTMENEIDDDTTLCVDSDMFRKLSDEVYCLKYFSTIEKGLEYINNNLQKKIFFISSGSIGEMVIPRIVDLPQIQGIYIFCGNIEYHSKWADPYANNISAILVHQDDLLVRLTRDIAKYLETKGDQYKTNEEILKARNCYAWSKKLLTRAKALGSLGVTRLIGEITKKIDEVQLPAICYN